MKVLILSDSHGNTYNVRAALAKHPDAGHIIFLGDGERDFEYLAGDIGTRPLTMVCGNCDFGSQLNDKELVRISGNLVYCVHGHKQFVKYGLDSLMKEAEETGASLALFGHTHEQYTDYIDGLHIMNPGSINEYEYGIADITEQGIVLSKMTLYKY